MPWESENFQPQITFLNQPRIREKALGKYNERRLELVPVISRFIASHHRLRKGPTNVSFSHSGVSSIVCFIESSEEKVVLKIPLNPNPNQGEALFLKAWRKQGTPVPEVLEAGEIEGNNFLLMNFIDAKSVAQEVPKEEVLERGVYEKMGATLRTMHTAKAEGFGRMKNGRPEFGTFGEWLDESEELNRKIRDVKDYSLLDADLHGDVDEAKEILRHYVGENPTSSFCHNDFSPSNVLNTTPLTAFDPDPIFNHPHLDVSRSIVLVAIFDIAIDPASKQLLKGYFQNEPFDERAIHAGVIIQAAHKFQYWNKIGNTRRMDLVRDYLRQNRALL